MTGRSQYRDSHAMNKIETILDNLDSLQQRVHFLGFSFAVIKKYGDDQVGYQAALLTYYAFLSLFPLLLILTTLTQQLLSNNPALQTSILHGVTNYFPVLGTQLSAHIHSLHRNGLALLVGLVVIFYGTRGVADVFRHGVQHVWPLRRAAPGNFLQSAVTSFKIILIGGGGLVGASIAGGLAASAGHGLGFRMLSFALNLVILYLTFFYILRLCLPMTVMAQELRVAAIATSVGLAVTQLLGGFILIHVLKNLDALYSYFATTLGLMFWIYLQAQVIYYAVEISVVKNQRLWPRSLTGKRLTKADIQLQKQRHNA